MRAAILFLALVVAAQPVLAKKPAKSKAVTKSAKSPTKTKARKPAAETKNKVEKKKAEVKPPPEPVAPAFTPAATLVAIGGSALPSRSSRYFREFNSGFGLLAFTIPGVVLQTQMRFLSSRKLPVYFGIDGQFGLFDPAFFLSLMPGVWYDFVLRYQPLATLTFGLTAGPSFAKGIPLVPDQSFAIFGEVGLSYELDDLAAVRVLFRPGVVGGRFAMGSSLLMGFRFQ
jgi:hypothetical protein